MTPQETDPLVAEALADYHRRRALGESPDPSAYRDQLEESYEDFVDVLAAEAMFDDLLEPATEVDLPRPFGEYTLLRELGRGAVGVVYEALHRKLGRRAAIKVLRTGFDTDQLARERFLREARACAQVRDDSIVEIYEADEVQGRPFYAMALIEGRTIEQIIKSDEELDPKDVCRGLAGIAGALQKLHDAGIVHRDVKPSNVIVRPDGLMVLADFGLARTAVAETLSRTGSALGTPLYMSPEQMLGQREEIDGRTDVYGLGATLYQALCGVPPFKTGDVQALMRMVLSERPQDPGVHRDGMSQECGRIALKCLEKERSDRYDSAAALQRDLIAFAEGRPVEGRPLSGLQRASRAVRKHRFAAIAASLLVCLLIWQLFLRPPPPPKPAMLTASVWPDATVRIDDGDPIPTPVSKYELEPNRTYKLTFESPGFLPLVIEWKAAPGSEKDLSKDLRMEHPPTAEALDKVERRLRPKKYEGTRNTRDAAEFKGVSLLYPRGLVRISDLESFAIRVDSELLPGTIAFRVGNRVLSSEPIPAPEYEVSVLPIPQTVRDGLQPGDLVTWSYHYKAGGAKRHASAVFQVIDSEVEVALNEKLALLPEDGAGNAKLEKRIGAMKLRTLYGAGLDTAVLNTLTESKNIRSLAGRLDSGDASDLESMLILRDSIVRLFGEDYERTTWWPDVTTAVRQDHWDADVWKSLVQSN